jgi:hypothetical protein
MDSHPVDGSQRVCITLPTSEFGHTAISQGAGSRVRETSVTI